MVLVIHLFIHTKLNSLSDERVIFELPYLHRVNFHGSLVGLRVVPSFVPLAPRVPEGVDRVWVRICPRLVALAVGEVTIGATNGNVQDQVEVLVEGGIHRATLPRVVSFAKITSLPEGFSGVDVKDHISGIVKVGLNAIGGPCQTIDVEVISERVWVCVLLRGQLIFV